MLKTHHRYDYSPINARPDYNWPEGKRLAVHFLDHEAFFLHTTHYLKWASKILDFPIDYLNPDIMKFISEDANHKYVKYIDEHWLDEVILAGCQPTRQDRINNT